MYAIQEVIMYAIQNESSNTWHHQNYVEAMKDFNFMVRHGAKSLTLRRVADGKLITSYNKAALDTELLQVFTPHIKTECIGLCVDCGGTGEIEVQTAVDDSTTYTCEACDGMGDIHAPVYTVEDVSVLPVAPDEFDSWAGLKAA